MRKVKEKPDQAVMSHAVSRPLHIFVPYTTPQLSRAALEAAAAMGEDLRLELILTAVHLVPYPLPLDCPDVQRSHLIRRLTQLTESSVRRARIRVVMARDLEDAFRRLLPPSSIVFLATRKRWWRTAEESLARALAREGHHIVLLTLRRDGHPVPVSKESLPAALTVEGSPNHA